MQLGLVGLGIVRIVLPFLVLSHQLLGVAGVELQGLVVDNFGAQNSPIVVAGAVVDTVGVAGVELQGLVVE